MTRSTLKLRRSDPAWQSIPQTWGMRPTAHGRVTHRITKAATPDGSTATHALTACGSYLIRTVFYFDAPDSVDLCEPCLIGDTVFHAVYVFRTPAGESLYVGYSADLLSRISNHRRDSAWWNPSLTLTYTVYDSEYEARKSETATIIRLKPVHNAALRTGGPRSSSRKATLHIRGNVLEELISAALDIPVEALTDAVCADFLGIAYTTYWRMRTDPDWPVSGGLVAQIMTVCGGRIPEELLEARAPAIAHLAAVA